MKKIPFVKMSGAGNDFVVIDNYNGRLKLTKAQIMSVCRRRFAIGADGLILLENSKKSGFDFYMRFYNNDGREAEMCGNGGRCIARFAYLTGRAGKRMKFLAKDGEHEAIITPSGDVMLKMIEPFGLQCGISVSAGGRTYYGAYVNTGVPHFVTLVSKMIMIDVMKDGRKIRNSSKFRPKGANVNFVQQKSKNKFLLRTYERGVEAETLACGTGAVASAIIMNAQHKAGYPVTLYAKGGTLKVYFDKKDKKFSNVWLEGNASLIMEGSILEEAFK